MKGRIKETKRGWNSIHNNGI